MKITKNIYKFLLLFSLFLSSTEFLQAQTFADFTISGYCYGDSTHFVDNSILGGGSPSYSWDFDSSGNFIGATGKRVDTFLSYGYYKVGLRVITSIDTSIKYKYVLIQFPIPGFTINQDTQCLYGNYFIFTTTSQLNPSSPGFLTYHWDFGDSKTADSAYPVYSYSKSDTFHVKLVATTNQGCKDSITHFVVVKSDFKADFSINSTIQCILTNSFTFTNTSQTCKQPIDSVLWDLDSTGKFTDTGSVITNHIFTNAKEYWIGLKIKSGSTTDSIYKKVIVNIPPVIKFYINDTAQCLAGNKFIFNDSTLGNNIYSWAFGDGNTDTAKSPTYTYLISDTFKVKLIASSSPGCNDTVSKVLYVWPSPKVSFSILDSIKCPLDTFKFKNNSFIIPSSSLNYLWKFGDTSYTAVSDTIHIYKKNGIYTTILIGESNQGCVDSFSKIVYSSSTPKAAFTINDTAQCEKGNSFIFTNISNSCNPIDSVLWDLDGNGIFDNAKGNIVVDTFPLGVHKIGMKVFSGSGFDSIYKQINVYLSPIANFTINLDTQLITTNNFIFSNASTPVGALTYYWDFGDTSSFTGKDTVNHSYKAPGNYSVKLIVATGSGCKDSIIKTVTVIPSIVTVDFTADTVCFGDSTTLKASVGGNILKYYWDINNDSLFNDDSGAVIKYQFPLPGTFPIGLQIITTTGIDTIYKNVTVYPKPSAGFSINNPAQPLAGNNFVFTNTSTITSGSLGYFWNFGDTNTSLMINPSHTYSSTGTFNVKLIVASNFGCKDSIVQAAQVIGYVLSVDFTVNNSCVQDSVIFKNLSTVTNDTIVNYIWYFGDSTLGKPSFTINTINPKHPYNKPGIYTVKLIAVLASGNKDSISKVINIFSNPTFNLSSSADTFCQGKNVVLSVSGVFDSIVWSTGYKGSNINVIDSGKYSVKVYDSNGCSATKNIQIYETNCPILTPDIMSLFTPNGDGINDYFKILNLDKFGQCKLNIFSRWGDEVYSTNDYKNDWDGKYKGKTLPEGAYYYVLETQDGKTYKGCICILK